MSSSLDYTSNETPANYVCGECKASGVKLWRPWAMQERKYLICATCLCQECGIEFDSISADDDLHYRLSQMYVPAIPRADSACLWRYKEAPEGAMQWWLRLPLKEGIYRHALTHDFKPWSAETFPSRNAAIQDANELHNKPFMTARQETLEETLMRLVRPLGECVRDYLREEMLPELFGDDVQINLDDPGDIETIGAMIVHHLRDKGKLPDHGGMVEFEYHMPPKDK